MTDKLNATDAAELKSTLEAHEAREVLAHYTPGEDGPEAFEELSDDTAKKLASEYEQSARTNAHGDEFQGAVNGNVVSIGRSEWEQQQNDE